MKHARRKQFNPINAPALARWIVITAFIGVTGLIYVYLNVQLYHEGNKKKALEIELGNLHSETTAASGQIDTLTSRVALQRRLKEGYLKMTPIAEQNIVRLRTPAPLGEDAVQPVVNQRAGR